MLPANESAMTNNVDREITHSFSIDPNQVFISKAHQHRSNLALAFQCMLKVSDIVDEFTDYLINEKAASHDCTRPPN